MGSGDDEDVSTLTNLLSLQSIKKTVVCFCIVGLTMLKIIHQSSSLFPKTIVLIGS